MSIAFEMIRNSYWKVRSRQLQKWRHLKFRLTHRGRERLCSVCGWQGSEFCDADGVPDDRCPACHSLPRHRLLALVLDQLALPKPGSRILHVSPKGENGLARRFRRRARSYLTIDKGGPWNSFDDGDAMVQMDLTALDLASASIDFVMCSHVLENIEDDSRAIREIYRVLAPGGVAALQVQIYGEVTVKVERPTQEDYFHWWHPGLDYFRRFETAGFAVHVYDKGQADEKRLRLYSSALVPICTKPE